MQVSVTFRHMKPSDPIREYAEDRIDKITKIIDGGGEAQIVLSVEKHFHVAHIELLTEGALRMRSIEKSEDMYGSIDMAVDKLVRQVKRYREKIKSHREAMNGKEVSHQIFEINEEAPTNGDINTPPRIVRTETIVAKEMNVEAAVMQMDLLHTDFLVFTNTSNHQVNVVYRLPDGQYGLIEAHSA